MTKKITSAPFGTCPAPMIRSPKPCGRWRPSAGARTCDAHAGTDPKGRCADESPRPTGTGAPARCHAWPLVGLPFCAAHDPAAKAARQAARTSAARQLVELRQLLERTPLQIRLKALELLVVTGRLRAAEVVEILGRYRIG